MSDIFENETPVQVQHKNRVIFLDIDGPMIPFSMFLVDSNASYGRRLAEIPFAGITHLCKETNAKVVFNTMHNQDIYLNGKLHSIHESFLERGFPENYIHPDMKTKFPFNMGRDVAISEWLSRHPEVEDWVAFDDVEFTRKDNLIWIEPSAGIHLVHINKVLDRWGYTTFLVL